MKDLKENLFSETLRAFNRVRLAVDKYGLPSRDIDRERDRAVFCALYSLIEERKCLCLKKPKAPPQGKNILKPQRHLQTVPKKILHMLLLCCGMLDFRFLICQHHRNSSAADRKQISAVYPAIRSKTYLRKRRTLAGNNALQKSMGPRC